MRVRDLVLVFVSLAFGSTALAQNFSESEKQVWDKMQEALSLGSSDDLAKIAKRSMNEVNGIYDKLEGAMSFADDVDKWTQLELVQKALDQANGDNVLGVRVANLKKLTLEQRQKRAELMSKYVGANSQVQAAQSAKDEGQLQEGVKVLTDLAQGFFDLGDAEYRIYCLVDAARGLDALQHPAEGSKLMDDATAAVAQAGFKNWKFAGQMPELAELLKLHSADPNAKPGGVAAKAPGSSTGTSWSNDAEGQRWSDPIPVKMVFDEKLFANFATPSFYASENTQAWTTFGLQGNGPTQFTESFAPLGKQLKVSRDGVKIFFDLGDGKKREAKVISKPNVFEFSAEQKNSDNVDVVGKYAVLLACGNETENFFGLSVKTLPTPTQFDIRFSPACYLKGKVFDQDLLVFDDNVSGRFGDPKKIHDGTVLDGAEFSFNDAMLIGKAKSASPWTEYLEHDGAFYRLKLDPIDMTVRTRKLGIETGFVKLAWKGPVKPEVVSIEETGEFVGAFFNIGDKPVRVPVGTYRLSYGIVRQGKGAQEKFCIILPGDSTAFDVKPNEEHTVEIGAPFTFKFKTEPQAKGVKVVGRSVQVYGKANELYCHFRDDPPIPDEVTARVKGGAPVGKAQAMKRATLDIYQKDSLAIWSPLDLVIDGPPGATFEVKMELKKHKLLGGPIKSDWQ